jgi:hypothetical protein
MGAAAATTSTATMSTATVSTATVSAATMSAAATVSAAATMSAAATVSAAATMSTAAAVGKYDAQLPRSKASLVERMERRQTDVRNFLVTEGDGMKRWHILQRHCRCRCSSRCGQRHAGDS